MRRVGIRRSLVVAVASAVLLTGACGSGDDGAAGPKDTRQSPLEAVLASSSKTAEAKSSKMAFSLTAQGVQGVPAGSITVSGEGAFDYAARHGAFTMSLPAIGGQQGGPVEAVTKDSTIYQKLPPQLGSLLGGKPWVKIDLNQVGRSAGIDLNSITQASSGDPTQALQFLRGAAADVVEVGKEQVRGEAVTHYRGTIDMNKAASAAPPEQQPSLQKLAQVYGQPLPFEVWVDGEGRLRKMTYAVDLARLSLPPEATAGEKLTGSFNFTMELFDFGAPVSVTIPPADQVSDLAQLSGGRGR